MKLTKEIWAVIMFFITLGAATAQPPTGSYTVYGKVLEQETQQPLEYVNVVIYNMPDSSLVAGTISKADGSFEITSKNPGMYYLTADFIGYKKQFVNKIMLKPGSESYNIGELLLHQTNVGIDEIEVVGERPFVSYQIDKKVVEVSKNPLAQGGTAVEALENVPSIETDMEGNVSVRGSSEFTVLIDGRQSPISGSDALKQIPASAIDKIEIITNPSVKYDPDGTAGIINVITKKGKLKGHSLVLNGSLGSSPMASISANYTYRMKKATLYAGADYSDFQMGFETFDNREIIDSLAQSSFIHTDKTGQRQHSNFSLKGGVDYFLSDANTLSLGGSYNSFKFARDFNSQIKTTNSATSSFQLSHTGYTAQPETWQVNVGDKQVFGGNKDHFLTIDFMHQIRKGSTDDGMDLFSSDNTWKQIYPALNNEAAITTEKANRTRLEINYSLPVSDKLAIEAGYTLRIDESNKEYTRFLYDEGSQNWSKNSEFDNNSEYSRNINAIWALAKGKIFGLGYSVGLRGENTNRITKTTKDSSNFIYEYFGHYLSAAISKEWKNGHTLQVNYSERINRPRDYYLNPFPALNDGYSAFVANPELKPENASDIELNYQKSWGRQFVALETFYRHTKDEIERIYTTIDDTLLVRKMENIGVEERIGAELGGNVKFAQWWYVNPVVTVYQNKEKGTVDDMSATASSIESRVTFTNNFTVNSKTRIQLMGNYRSPRKSLYSDRKEMYWASAAIRRSFFDQKLSVVFRVDDIFSTRGRAETIIAENVENKSSTITYSEGHRKSPMFVLSLNLNLNQKNDKKNGPRNNENGDGMDMDF